MKAFDCLVERCLLRANQTLSRLLKLLRTPQALLRWMLLGISVACEPSFGQITPPPTLTGSFSIAYSVACPCLPNATPISAGQGSIPQTYVSFVLDGPSGSGGATYSLASALAPLDVAVVRTETRPNPGRVSIYTMDGPVTSVDFYVDLMHSTGYCYFAWDVGLSNYDTWDETGESLGGGNFSVGPFPFSFSVVGGALTLNMGARILLPNVPQGDAPFGENNYYTITAQLSSKPAVDLVADSLTWDTSQGGIDFQYEIDNGPLTTATTAELFWANGTTVSDIISGAPIIYTQPILAGTYGVSRIFNVPASAFANPPFQDPLGNDNYILLVLDHDDLVIEPNKVNNVMAIPWGRDGVDYAFTPRPDVATLRELGYNFVIRYVGGSKGKQITASEAGLLKAAGLDIIIVFENTATDMLRGYIGGVKDAATAAAQAIAAGAPRSFFCYFNCDFDAQPSQQKVINAYLDGAAFVLGADRVGFYGPYGPLKRVLDAGKAAKAWETVGFSHGNIDPRICLYQYQINQSVAGGSCDLDYGYGPSLGQWSVNLSIPTHAAAFESAEE